MQLVLCGALLRPVLHVSVHHRGSMSQPQSLVCSSLAGTLRSCHQQHDSNDCCTFLSCMLHLTTPSTLTPCLALPGPCCRLQGCRGCRCFEAAGWCSRAGRVHCGVGGGGGAWRCRGGVQQQGVCAGGRLQLYLWWRKAGGLCIGLPCAAVHVDTICALVAGAAVRHAVHIPGSALFSATAASPGVMTSPCGGVSLYTC